MCYSIYDDNRLEGLLWIISSSRQHAVKSVERYEQWLTCLTSGSVNSVMKRW